MATTTRDKLLSDSRSGARPLGGSPGAEPREEPRTAPREVEREAPRGPEGSTGRTGPQGSPGPKGSGGSGGSGKRKSSGGILGGKGPGKGGGIGHNYQAIVIAEFIAAELLAAFAPIASNKKGASNQGTMSPYAAKDITKMFAIGAVYFILSMLASAGRGSARLSAWFGGLVLLAVGLTEASNLAGIFSTLAGGKDRTVAQLTAAAPSPLEVAVQSAPPLQASTWIPTGSTTGTTGSTPPPTGFGGNTHFVQEAAKFIGTPYVWGGDTPKGFDCSGLVQYSLEQIGLKNVPRTSEEQWNWVDRIPESGLQPGDLIFENWPGESSPGHVAIYAGSGKIIQAPAPGEDVQEVPWSPSSVSSQGGTVVGYGRVPGLKYTPGESGIPHPH